MKLYYAIRLLKKKLKIINWALELDNEVIHKMSIKDLPKKFKDENINSSGLDLLNVYSLPKRRRDSIEEEANQLQKAIDLLGSYTK